ncbi:MAG: ketoacyl-ACP synthase III [Candidatus Hydrogenedentes bacterium]|nr:ketoacyl-ACP synthase III [Candidatus Hydrogenedentota bacterium]
MIRSRIIGTGSFLPPKVVTNFDLEKIMDTTDAWIQQRTGIKQRHIAEPGVGAADLGAPAARAALDAAGVRPEDIELIVCGTTSPDYLFPNTSCLIQHQIGATRSAAMDVNAACSGFMYALSTANAYVRAGVYKTVLVVGAEVLTYLLNWDKRDTAVLFGDGAGAVVLRAEKGEHGILTTHLGADGGAKDILWMEAGGSKCKVTAENVDGPERDVRMKGTDLFKRAVVVFGEAAQKALEATNMTVADIDLFIPHQANTRIIYTAAERLGLDREKVFVNIDHVANTTAASIPIAIDEALRTGRIHGGDIIMLAGFGAGLTWGSVLLRW